MPVTVGSASSNSSVVRSLVRPRSLRSLALWIWCLAGVVLVGVATLSGHDPSSAETWTRWDSQHYLSIAADGYELERCRFNQEAWCGNAGWFPAYPWLIGLLAASGLPLKATGVLVSWLFSLGIMWLLASTFLSRLPAGAAVGGLVFAAFIPGAVYQRAVFPLAMLGFFLLLALWLLDRERWAWAGVAAAVAAGSYHLGVLLVPVAVFFALAHGKEAGASQRIRRAALAGGIASLGPVVVVAAMWIQTGAPNAFLLVQEKYGHGLNSPAEGLSDTLLPLREPGPFALESVPAIQALLVTLILAAVAIQTLRRRSDVAPAEWLLLVTALALWLVPLTQENAGLYRTAAALVPLAPLAARLPTPLLLMCCAGAIAVYTPVALLFFRGTIV